MAWLTRHLRSIRQTYGLPRELPVVARLLVLMVLCAIPLPLIWWLAAPSSPVVVAVLLVVELIIVFGGLWRVLAGSTFSSLPDRRPMQAPSTRPLDPPGTPPAKSSQPSELPVGGPRAEVAPRAAGEHGTHVLVVASEAPSGEQLRALIGEDDREPVEAMVLAPALHRSALRFWLSDADEAIRRASTVQAATVAGLRAEGVSATGDTAEGDTTQAIQDALVTFPADRIVIFAHAPERERPHERVDPGAIAAMASVPVEVHELSA